MAVPRRAWPEVVYLTVLAAFSGIGYVALRHRTASIWPVILLHLVFNVAGEISTPGTIPYLRPLLAFAIPFVLLGCALFLLRNRRVRADGS
jgi:membrane protease YdiL (CAAX protease family)